MWYTFGYETLTDLTRNLFKSGVKTSILDNSRTQVSSWIPKDLILIEINNTETSVQYINCTESTKNDISKNLYREYNFNLRVEPNNVYIRLEK